MLMEDVENYHIENLIDNLQLGEEMCELRVNVNNITRSYNGALQYARYKKDKCVICFDKIVSCALLPCGHAQFCEICVPNLKNCPTCRTPIDGFLKIYF